MKKKTDREKIAEILNIEKIKCSNDLLLILKQIRTMGRNHQELAEKLLCLFIDIDKWEFGYSLEFYTYILDQYCPDNFLEMLRAVSGIENDYTKYNTAASRRQNYAKTLDDSIDESTIRKREDKALGIIAEDLFTTFIDEESRLLFFRKWMENVGLDPDKVACIKKSKVTDGLERKEKIKDKKKKRQKPKGLIKIFNNIYINLGTLVFLVCISFDTYSNFLARISIEIKDIRISIGNTFIQSGSPQIEEITTSVGEGQSVYLSPGGVVDPGIEVIPQDADKKNISSKVDNEQLVKVTQDLELMGRKYLPGEYENETNVIFIAGGAKSVNVHVFMSDTYNGDLKDGIYDDADIAAYSKE